MNKKIKCLLVSCGILASLSAVADTKIDFRHMVVQGVGKVSVKPDTAKLTVKVESATKTATSGKKNIDHAVSSLIENLTIDGLSRDDIFASNISIYPEFRWDDSKKKQVFVGHKASRSVTIVMRDLTKISKVLDIAINSGFSNVDNVIFYSENMQDYRKQAKKLAIASAKEEMELLSKELGITSQSSWRIEFQHGNGYPVPSNFGYEMSSPRALAKVDTGYRNQDIELTETVNIIYKIH